MPSVLGELFSIFLAPGFVAAFVTFTLNTRDERHRTAREYQTKFVDETRTDVRNAVNAGVAYFSNKESEKVPLLHAAVLLYERDVRQNLAAIGSACGQSDQEILLDLQRMETDFLQYLTGGDFGPVTAAPDPERIALIVGQGSLLRGKLSELRRHQLESARRAWTHPALVVFLLFGLVALGALFGLWMAGTIH